jgi:terminase large subunit-like protein
MLFEAAAFPDGSMGREAGLMEMYDRFQTGRLKVFAHLKQYFEEMRMYHRKEGKVVLLFDDLISASRYALMCLRFSSVSPRTRAKHKQRRRDGMVV